MSPEHQEEAPDPGEWRKDPAPQQEQKPAEMPGLGEGRIVHYVLKDGQHRPAVVVKNWHAPNGSCNLQVLVDGTNDSADFTAEECHRGLAWKTSVFFSAQPQPHTWHWPEKA